MADPAGRPTVLRIEELPAELDALVAASEAEGHAFLRRLRDDWREGANRFSLRGEALFEVRDRGELVAIGGLNRDPYLGADADADARVGRVRHLYVLPGARRRGVGSNLLAEIVEHAAAAFWMVRLRTLTDEGDGFYRAAGFEPTDEADATHRLIFR